MVDSSLLPQGNYGIAAGTTTGNASGALVGGKNNKNNNKNNNDKNGGTYFGPPGPIFGGKKNQKSGGDYIPTVHAGLDMTANSMTVVGGRKKNQDKNKDNNKNKKTDQKHMYQGGNYDVHIGQRGGKYIMHKGNKVYI